MPVNCSYILNIPTMSTKEIDQKVSENDDDEQSKTTPIKGYIAKELLQNNDGREFFAVEELERTTMSVKSGKMSPSQKFTEEDLASNKSYTESDKDSNRSNSSDDLHSSQYNLKNSTIGLEDGKQIEYPVCPSPPLDSPKRENKQILKENDNNKVIVEVEKIVEVPVEKIVEKIVEVDNYTNIAIVAAAALIVGFIGGRNSN